jgi:hypothetical protein
LAAHAEGRCKLGYFDAGREHGHIRVGDSWEPGSELKVNFIPLWMQNLGTDDESKLIRTEFCTKYKMARKAKKKRVCLCVLLFFEN